MEKCGKLWRPDHSAADEREERGQVYSADDAGGAIEMRACSACAGNYEDPDRTAWTPDDEEDDESAAARRGSTEEFPAED